MHAHDNAMYCVHFIFSLYQKDSQPSRHYNNYAMLVSSRSQGKDYNHDIVLEIFCYGVQCMGLPAHNIIVCTKQ